MNPLNIKLPAKFWNKRAPPLKSPFVNGNFSETSNFHNLLYNEIGSIATVVEEK